MLTNLLKETKKLNPNQEEHQRLEYALKLNLRLLNVTLNDLNINVIN